LQNSPGKAAKPVGDANDTVDPAFGNSISEGILGANADGDNLGFAFDEVRRNCDYAASARPEDKNNFTNFVPCGHSQDLSIEGRDEDYIRKSYNKWEAPLALMLCPLP